RRRGGFCDGWGGASTPAGQNPARRGPRASTPAGQQQARPGPPGGGAAAPVASPPAAQDWARRGPRVGGAAEVGGGKPSQAKTGLEWATCPGFPESNIKN